MRCASLVFALALLGGATAGALAELATFDALPEGYYATEITDGGIRFFDLDRRLGDPLYYFTIERADGALGGWPEFFSAPNVLGLGGWVDGPDVGFSRCGEFKFATEALGTEARVEVFTYFCYVGNSVVLEAWLGDERVASDAFTFSSFAMEHHTLEVSGVTFDTLRVNGAGDEDQGVFFGVVDNVYVGGAVATEPATWGGVKSLFRN